MVSALRAPVRGDIGTVGYKQETLSVRGKGGIPVLVLSRERDRDWFGPPVAYLSGQANDAIVGHIHRLSVGHECRSGLPIWGGGTVLHEDGRSRSPGYG